MRRMDTRFVTALDSSNHESLLHVVAHWGPQALVVLNLSEGGAALKLPSHADAAKELKMGSQIDVSLELLKKIHPVTMLVRNVVGSRLHCQFVNKSPSLDLALKEFFVPKSLGLSLTRNHALSENPEVQALVEQASWHEVWVAPNQTGLFIWFGENDDLLRLLLVSKDLAWEWSLSHGVRTGHRNFNLNSESPDQAFEMIWDREISLSLNQYVTEILSTWLGMSDESQVWVSKLVSSSSVQAVRDLGSFPLLRRIREL